MKIVITGGAGFIGSRLVNALHLAGGYYIEVIDCLSPQVHGVDGTDSDLFESIKGKCVFHNQAVENITEWGQYLADCDVLIHLAAETGTGQSMYEIDRYNAVNCVGTAKICEYLMNQKHRVSKLLLSSSRSVYGEGAYTCTDHGRFHPVNRNDVLLKQGCFDPVCPVCGKAVQSTATREDAPVLPASIYALTKYYQERLFDICARSLGVSYFGLRLQNVYGPGQSLRNPYTGILSIFSNLLLNGQPIDIFEDGLESRDFVYIDDVVNALVAAVAYQAPYIGVMNVGAGQKVDVLTVLKHLAANYGVEPNFRISGNYRLGDIRHNYADISAIQQVLGYSPRYDFRAGLAEFCAWVQGQALPAQDYMNSLSELKARGLLVASTS